MQYFKIVLFVCAFALVNPTSAWCMEGEKSDIYLNIPNEIWVHIVSYLKIDDVKNLMFLSKEFHRLIKETTRSLKISKETPSNELHSLLSPYPNLKTLDLTRRNQTINQDMRHFWTLDNLTHLNLNWCNELTDQGLSQLSNFTKLKHLYLPACNNITDTGLEQIKNLTTACSKKKGNERVFEPKMDTWHIQTIYA